MLTTNATLEATRALGYAARAMHTTYTRHAWRARAACPLSLMAGLTALFLSQAPALGDRSDYVGAQVCKTCHAGAYDVWQQSAHARTDERVGQAAARTCLACHTTGEAPAGRPFFSGVQCEACHGPGAGYATDDVMRDPTLARLLGLRDLSTPAARAALCAECHQNATQLLPFDADKRYRRIQHK